ncbi:MAG: hypothetical protein KDA79_12860, partial [Planctomycetaceae bacterium]|nr:hypothetical protein [Planctomycetaceae bacterium]
GQPAGLVSVQREAAVVPHDLLDEIDRTISELCPQGVAGSGGPWRDRTTRLLDRCRQAGLIWPAELITDVLHAIERYQEHDARFDPAEVVQWLGELAIRSAAIRHDTGAVPQLLIRGSASDTPTEIRSARFIGLGCGVHCGPGSVRLTAFHQNVDSGNVVAIHRDFADPPADSGEEPREFHLLARTTVSRGVSFAALAAGQMLLKSGRRTPGHRLTLPRGHFGVNPQSFHWEKLRAPVLAEGVAEIASRLETLPPSSLRPRRIAEDLHVCPLQQVESIEFDAAAQRLVARARDPRGDALTIVHPYNTRGQQGFESLAATLERHGADIRFVAGHVRQGPYGFEMHPLCVA